MKSLSLSQPHVIVMVGIPGSGKSFFAEKFAETFKTPCVNHAEIALLSQATAEVVEKLASYQLDELFKTGLSIIVDGACDTHVQRAELTKKAHSHGYETLYVWVQIDPATAEIRSTKASKDRKTPLLTQEEFTRLVKRFSAPASPEKSIVISGKHTYATQAKVVLKKLSAPREIAAHSVTPTRGPQTVPITRRNIAVR